MHSGLKFHSKMEGIVVAGDLCEVEGCKMQDYKEFQQFFWKRRLSSPWNLRGLERDWKEAMRKRVVTPELEVVYLEKREEMMEKEKLWEEKNRIEEEQLKEKKRMEEEQLIEKNKVTELDTVGEENKIEEEPKSKPQVA